MMRPQRRSIIPGASARASSRLAVRFTWSVWSQISSVSSASGIVGNSAASSRRMSIRPITSTALVARRSTSPLRPRSVTASSTRDWRPSPISATAATSSASCRLAIRMSAPASARPWAIAFPSPRLPPVTRALRPERSNERPMEVGWAISASYAIRALAGRACVRVLAPVIRPGMRGSRASDVVVDIDQFELPITEFLPGITADTIEFARTLLEPNHIDVTRNRLLLAIQSFVLHAGGRTILLDSCVGEEKERRLIPEFHRRAHTGFLDGLARIDVPAESVDFVFCTHLHVDHVGWNTRLHDGRWVPTFPNARYLTGRREFEYWQQRDRDPIGD